MTRKDLKELVKQHFSLIEKSHNFAKATLADGSKVSNEMDSDFAIGQVLYIEDKEGTFVPAPVGEHVSESGIQFVLDEASKIVGLKKPDGPAEGSLMSKNKMAVEPIQDNEDEAIAAEEGMAVEEKMEMPSLEDIIDVIGEVVETRIMEMKSKMSMIEEDLVEMKKKFAEISVDPATGKTEPGGRGFVPNADKFSRVDANAPKSKAYQNALKKLANK
jgi:hypothetical protein